MAGPIQSTHDYQVRLHRDGFATPWGFRLQGGKDFKTPLTIQRVFVGSPAEGDLHRGDIILSIDNHDASSLNHKQAQDLIKSSGGSLSLRIKRGTVLPPRPKTTPPSFSTPHVTYATSSLGRKDFRFRPLSTPAKSIGPPSGFFGHIPIANTASRPHVPTFGVDYSRRPVHYHRPTPVAPHHDQYPNYAAPHHEKYPSYSPGPVPNLGHQSLQRASDDSMIHKIQQSLDDVIWQPRYDEPDEQYEQRPVRQLAQQFATLEPTTGRRKRPDQHTSHHQPRATRSTHRPWAKPPTSPTTPVSEFGWTPKNFQPSRPTYSPHRPASAPHTTPSYMSAPTQHHLDRNDLQDPGSGPPAWAGSLRPHSGARPWDAPPSGFSQPKSVSFQPTAAPVHSPRVQTTHLAPGQSPQYQQQNDADPNDPQVVHLQYNSPLNLYSRQNVEETLQGQTYGKPGHGTMGVSGGTGPPKQFDATKSSVLQMIQQEERMPRGQVQGHGQDHYQQQHMAAQPMYNAGYPGEEMGASEF